MIILKTHRLRRISPQNVIRVIVITVNGAINEA